jgi:hypothetical protein
MQARPQGLVFLTAFVVLGTGCATTGTNNDDARTARLPTGITLLESNREQCAGSVAIDDSSIASARRSDLVISRGQNAVFEVEENDDDDIEVGWTCVGTADADRERIECPDDTSHVRITRGSTGDEFLLECYGDRDSNRR